MIDRADYVELGLACIDVRTAQCWQINAPYYRPQLGTEREEAQ